MKQIAIIGSGQAGLLAGHGLLKAGYEVTLYSDKTAQDWLDKAWPTGTAARFRDALAFERELGLNMWDAEVPALGSVELTFCHEIGNTLLKMKGRMTPAGQAIDLRLQSAAWLNEFEARGGQLVIEKVTIERLDEITAENDLTLVATGRGPLAQLFPRDAERSEYDTPQRHLSMIVATGASMPFDEQQETTIQFNVIEGVGEAFWVPYYHKTLGKCWNIVFEAMPGGPMDRFAEAKTGQETLAIAKKVIRELFPWDWNQAKDLQLADENSWLVGRFAPTVRKPVGVLPSGRVVMPLGDASMTLDPAAGQGANNGSRMAHHLVKAIVAHGDQAFTAEWMTDTFEQFYADSGEATNDFSSMILKPITPAGKELLIAQIGSDGRSDNKSNEQLLANAFVGNFRDPRSLTALLHDQKAMRAFISETTGRHWFWSVMKGFATIAKGQIRHKLGLRQIEATPVRPTIHLTPSHVAG